MTRRRVTLRWDGPPLSLPGEPPADSPAPDAERAIEAPVTPEQPDGWERQGARTPPPFRPSEPAIEASGDYAEGDALDLVDRRSRPASAPVDLAVEMSERYALGDYTAALQLAELVLGREPSSVVASQVAAGCRARLEQLYRARLGSLARVPRLAVEGSEVRWLGLDHRAAFLLSRVDGQCTVADLVDVSGMPALEALKTLVELLDGGAISI